MPETLVLRLNAKPGQPHSWLVVDAAGTRIGETRFGSLDELNPLVQNRAIVVLLPANHCLVSHSNLPVKSTQKLMQALPFVFEDHLIGNIEATHFAFGKRNDEGQFPVAVIAREKLDGHIQQLAKHNLHPQSIYAEDAVLPITENGCTVLLEADEALLRTANGDAVLVAHESLVHALQLAQSQLDDKNSNTDDDEEFVMPITVYIDDASAESGEQTITHINDQFAHTEFRRLPHGALSKLAIEAIRSEHPNLLQGDYAPSTNIEKLFAPWRFAAMAAGLLLAVMIGFKAVELKTMKNRLAAVNAAMMEVAKATFPQQQRIIDPYGLFQTQLKALPGGLVEGQSEFLDFMHVVTQASVGTESLTLHRLNYRAGNLDLEVEASNVQVLDSFANKISGDQVWTANLLSTKPSAEKVQGRLSIVRSAP